MNRRIALLVVAVALGSALAGCGSSPKRSSAAKGSAAQASTSTTVEPGPGAGSNGAGGQAGTPSQAAGAPRGTSEFCRSLEARFSGSVKVLSKLSAAPTPEEKRKVASQLVADNQAVQAVAPADVKPCG